MINMIHWLLHWPKCFYFLHLSSYINSRSVSLSEYDKSRTLFSDVERKSAWHNRLIKWITPRIAKRCVADVAFSHDKRHVVGFTGASSMHLDKTGRILVQYSSFSESFRARSRVTPFSVSKKRHGLRPWRVLHARFDDDSLNLSIDYIYIVMSHFAQVVKKRATIYKYHVYEIIAWPMWFRIPC